MLRFNQGITSVGYTTTLDRPLVGLEQIVALYPSMAKLLQEATLVAPSGGPFCSERLQRFFDPVIDARRIMLPTAAVTLDPLHSTGIAHALAGVERLCELITCSNPAAQRELIERYRQSLLGETQFLDQLVSTAYALIDDFQRFTVACMLYFAGAIRCEERYQLGETPERLWNADDPDFVAFVDWSCDRLREKDSGYFQAIRERLAPWNTAGLMNRENGNRYAYTATKGGN
jgi:FADH2 O2-dependent halogenase